MTASSAKASMFAPARRAGDFVYASSVGPGDENGTVGPGDVKAQTARALANLDARLQQAGSSLAMAAAVSVCLNDPGDFAAMNEAYRAFFPKDPPTRTTIGARGAAADTALVEIGAVGIRAGAERRVVHPSGWMASPRPYSYGILSGDTLFLSGLVSRSGRDDQVVAGDVGVQVRTALENAGAILGEAGFAHADVVQSRLYIPDVALFAGMNAAYRPFFAADPPVRATVKAALMGPAYLFEATLLAVKGARTVVTTPNADGTPGTPNPNLSSAIGTGDRLFVSGILGNTEATRGDAAAQTRETLVRVERTLTAAGSSWADVREAVVYVSDLEHRAAVEGVWAEQFPGDRPAGVLIETPLMAADGLVEVMVTADRR
jgi:enamine deaminase RidA (YjgF/YER057c/UK114 family)